MNLLGWLRKPKPDPGDTPTRAEFEALTAAVRALDEVQVSRELEWVNIRDQLRRQLGRLDAHKQRDAAKEGRGGETETLRELLRSKYPRISNGGE